MGLSPTVFTSVWWEQFQRKINLESIDGLWISHHPRTLSVNDGIDPVLSSLSYASIDHSVLVLSIGRGAMLVKGDIKKKLADGLHWILSTKGISHMLHYFILVTNSVDRAHTQKANFYI